MASLNTKKTQQTLKKKSLYLAVLLGMQAFSAMAEEPAQPKAVDLELKEVEVQATKEKPAGYQATKTRVGKTLQDPHDIPQAVTSVTRELMHDQQVGSLREALRNVSGLTLNAAEGGRSGDNMMLRSFYTFGDIYLDGIRDTAQYNRETFNIEQVDVLRGSAAMLFGRGQAGGVINQVSKMAHLEDKNAVSASLGEYDYHQVTGDFNKQLGENVAIRINLMDRDEETYRKNPANGDRPEFDRNGIAVSLGIGLETENEFFLNHITTKTRDIPDYGASFFQKKPIDRTLATGKIDDSTFYGSDKNFDDSETSITTGIFTHQFSNDTQLRTQLRHAEYERDYWAKTPSSTALPSANGSVGGNQTRTSDYKTDSLQADFSTIFKLADMKNQFLAGAEYLKEDSFRTTLRQLNAKTGQPFASSLTANQLAAAIAANGVIYDKDVLSTALPNKFKADNYAVYAQDTVEFVKDWSLLLGIRRDKMNAQYSGASSPKLNYSENSYRAGLSWQPSELAHYYASYSDSFSPTADLYQLTVTPLPPERSETIELGAKWLFFNGDLAFRTALYRSTKDWERNTDLEVSGNTAPTPILTKKRRTNGLEFEAAGRITDKWQVFSGLALMDAKIIEAAENVSPTTGVITKADKRFEGERARNTPVATFNLWSTYNLTTNWKVGGGVEAKGERYGYNPAQAAAVTSTATGTFNTGKFNPNVLPGYARVDAMLAYEEKKWAVRLNVKNLLDKTYYDAIYDNGGFSVPGNRRQAIVTTEFNF